MNTTATTFFLLDGPRDGDTVEFTNPPQIIRVEGDTQGFAYEAIGGNQYLWMRCISCTLKSPKPAPLPTLPASPAPKKRPPDATDLQLILAIPGIILVILGGLIFIAMVHPTPPLYPHTTIGPRPAPTLLPTPAPTPASTRAPTVKEWVEQYSHPNWNPYHTENSVPTPAPEVRRAVPINTITGVIPMPYGQNVAIRVLGNLPNQEALPLQNNAIGDAYRIGRYLFVWVAPNSGPAQWIDSVIP